MKNTSKTGQKVLLMTQVAEVTNINFLIATVVLAVALLVAMLLRGVYKERTTVLFLVLVLVVLVTAGIDVMDERSTSIPFRNLANFIYFIARNSTLPIYAMYCISLMGIWHRIKNDPLRMLMLFVPYIVLMLMVLFNPMTHSVYVIDDQCVYHRGEGFWVLYVIAAYYLMFLVYIIVKNRKLLNRSSFIILISFVPINIALVVTQMLIRDLRVEVFGTVVVTVVLAVSVHKPEEYVDSIVGVQSSIAFDNDTRRSSEAGRPFTILLFKFTNHMVLHNNMGWDMYSELLVKIGDRMKQINELTGAKADIYYLDKGTFAVVAADSRYSAMYSFGHMICDYVAEPIKLGKMEVMLDTRVCLINCPHDIGSLDALDNFINTYEQKIPEDKGLVVLSDISESKDFRMRNDMELIINRGISGHLFQMYYQPIYSFEKQRFTSAEALIRLIDEEYGFVSPAVFIPVAEENGAIHQIGDYVIEEVCRFIASPAFKDLGVDYIEVNLSAVQCLEANLAEKIDLTLAKYGVSPSQINLEITETSADYDPTITDKNIDKLMDMGFKFSLDDYGTGYSNIKRVVSLPLDIVKLDKTLVDEMNNSMMWTVIHNTVTMLKRMKKKVLVEGVEEKEAMEAFKKLGCDYIQGFYYSKPLPEKDFVRFIKKSLEGTE